MSLKTYLESDLDTFFNIGEFAEEVTYHLSAEITDVTVQFFDVESDLGDSMFRKLVVKVADLPTLSNQGYFLIDSKKYGVISFYEDEQSLIYNVLTQESMA